MDSTVGTVDRGDQVLLAVPSLPTRVFDVMDLNPRNAAAELALPIVTRENPSPELLIPRRVETQLRRAERQPS